MWNVIVDIARESWLVLGQMAPYLLFGFLAAGLLSVYLSARWVERHLGGGHTGAVFKAALFGVPLPLCSCSVIPVSVAIRKQGASRAATTAFLLSTPQTGVDSIAVTYALLGPVFAIFRPVTAMLAGLVGGGLVQAFGRDKATAAPVLPTAEEPSASCCSSESKPNKLNQIINYGLITLPRDIGPALLLGVLIAGVMAAIVPQDYLMAYVGGGVGAILLMMVLGVPVYVCATASVPIAAGLIHMGASPGAALAFLIAGPATNAAGFSAIWKVLGGRSAMLYLATVALSALGFGLLLDWLMPQVIAGVPALGEHNHEMGEGGLWGHLWAALMLGLMAWAYLSDRFKGATTAGNPETPPLQTLSTVGAPSCCCHTEPEPAPKKSCGCDDK
jgi:uncharacterized membrane protein YraQ (UPF0718 family)